MNIKRKPSWLRKKIFYTSKKQKYLIYLKSIISIQYVKKLSVQIEVSVIMKKQLLF